MARASSRARRCAGLLAIATSLSVARSARADDERERDLSMFIAEQPAWDAALIATGLGAWAVGVYAVNPRTADVAPLDGAGSRPYRAPADVASDVLVFTSLGLIAGTAFITEHANGRTWAQSLRAPVILGEALLVGAIGTAWLKNVGVCRPFAWDGVANACRHDGGVPVNEEERHRSFPSGHMTNLASIAGASLGLVLLPRRMRLEFLPLALGATGLAWVVGGLRVRTGAHSWVDVTGGFLIGGTLGFATSAMHLRRARVRVAPSASGLIVYGRF